MVPTFNRPNVELVTDDLREITADGIVTKDGQTRKVDCIILGTGFVVDPRICHEELRAQGRKGHNLAEDWKPAPRPTWASPRRTTRTCISWWGPTRVGYQLDHFHDRSPGGIHH